MSGLIGLVILVADIWALVQIWTSKGKGTEAAKLLWTLLILLLPLIGLALWWFLGGPGAKKK